MKTLGIAAALAVALGVGAWRVEAGTMELTTLLMVLMAGIEVFRPQRDLRSLLHNGMMGMSAAESIFRVLDAKPEIVESEGAIAKDRTSRSDSPEFRDTQLPPLFVER